LDKNEIKKSLNKTKNMGAGSTKLTELRKERAIVGDSEFFLQHPYAGHWLQIVDGEDPYKGLARYPIHNIFINNAGEYVFTIIDNSEVRFKPEELHLLFKHLNKRTNERHQKMEKLGIREPRKMHPNDKNILKMMREIDYKLLHEPYVKTIEI